MSIGVRKLGATAQAQRKRPAQTARRKPPGANRPAPAASGLNSLLRAPPDRSDTDSPRP
jgi:hypothetical protein